jgi:hypothetical protein
MRKTACFLALLAVGAGVLAAETWRWKDANGVWQYSDRPVPGAEKVILPSAPKPGSVAAPRAPSRGEGASLPRENSSRVGGGEMPAFRGYTRCSVSMPEAEAVFHSVDAVPVSFRIEPMLQPGHRIEVLVDGKPYLPAQGMQSFVIKPVYRGSYTVSFRIYGAQGRQMCFAPATNFHVRQNSVLSPGRRRAG